MKKEKKDDKRRVIKRLLSLILCLGLLVSAMPFTALAENDEIGSTAAQTDPNPSPSGLPAESDAPVEHTGPSAEEEAAPVPTEEAAPTPTEEPAPAPTEEAAPAPTEEPAPTPESSVQPTAAPTADAIPSAGQQNPGVLRIAGEDVVGTGSMTDPFQIGSPAMFREIAVRYNDGTLREILNVAPDAELYFQLEKDIDLTSFADGWQPIGDSTRPFTDHFDGAGYTVENLGVNQTNAGLFGFIGTGGTVENLALESCEITGDEKAGGIAAENQGTIRNCSVTNASIVGETDAGGICGLIAADGKVEYCLFTGTVYTENGNAGGVTGTWQEGTLSSCAILAKSLTAPAGQSGSVAGAFGPVSGMLGENNIYWVGCAGANEEYASPKSSGELMDAQAWPQAFTTEPWTYEPSRMPSLGGAAALLPGYLGKLPGNGTQSDPYRIQNWLDLVSFADDVNNGNDYKGMYVKLTADIEMPEQDKQDGFTPIQNFSGTFDGNYKTIRGLTISLPGSVSVGMFGVVRNANIKNMVLQDVSILGDSLVGGLVGEGHDSTIEGCYVSGTVTATYKDVGGVMGSGFQCTVQSCFAEADVSGKHGVGGILSYMEGGSVLDCYTGGSLTSYYAGSIAGIAAHPELETCVVKRCYSTAVIREVEGPTLAGIYSGAGGVVGVTAGYSEDIIALNRTVGNISGTYSQLVGRYLGTASSGEGLAYWAMIPGNNMLPAYDKNSMGYSASQIRANTDGMWDAFSAPAWNRGKDGLPVLTGVPGALQKGAWPDWLKDDYDTLYNDVPMAQAATKTYIIKTAGNLGWLSKQPNDQLDGWTLDFQADISLKDYTAGIGWTPIGTVISTNNYKDLPKLTVKGNGHKVSDLHLRLGPIDAATGVGLFGALGSGSSITDLHVEKADMSWALGSVPGKLASLSAGGIVGTAYNTDIRFCSFDGTLDFLSVDIVGSCNVGGIVGEVFGIQEDAYRYFWLDGCAVRGQIRGNTAGGIVGFIGAASGGLIVRKGSYGYAMKNCYNLAQVEAEGAAGGLIGRCVIFTVDTYAGNSSHSFTAIQNCYNRGEVCGKTDAGGLVGSLGNMCGQIGHEDEKITLNVLSQCYNTGTVQTTLSPYAYPDGSYRPQYHGAGGLVGFHEVLTSGSGNRTPSRVNLSGFSLGPSITGSYPTDPIYDCTLTCGSILGADSKPEAKNEANVTVNLGISRVWQGQKLTLNGIAESPGGVIVPLTSDSIVKEGALKSAFTGVWNTGGVMPILGDDYVARYEWQTSAPPSHMVDADMGEITDPVTIEIHTPQELVEVSKNHKSNKNITLELTNDIDMEGVTGFVPFKDFSGKFDGNGYAVKNLVIDGDNSTLAIGFFANITPYGTVQCLSLVDCKVSGARYVGALAGQCNGQIKECAAFRSTGAMIREPNAIQVTDGSMVGGLVGALIGGGTIYNSYAALNVYGSSYIKFPGRGTGGLVGLIGYLGDDTGFGMDTVSNCFAAGTVQGYEYAGGLYGQIYMENPDRQAYSIRLENCYALPTKISVSKSGGGTGLVAGSITALPNTFTNQFAWSGLLDGSALPQPNIDGTAQMDVKALGASMNTELPGSSYGIWKKASDDATPILMRLLGDQYNYLPLEVQSNELEQENGIYLIKSAEDLVWMSEKLSEDNAAYDNGSYRLETNIRLADVVNAKNPWRPMPNFNGTFDGNGKTITITDLFAAGNMAGLFGQVDSEAVIKNLTVEGNISGDIYNDYGTFVETYAGLLAARMSGTVQNVTARGQLTANAWSVGGLVGSLENGGVIEDCVNRAAINVDQLPNSQTTSRTIGGIAGVCSNSTITGCTNTGAVLASKEAEGCSGGITGRLIPGTVRLCQNGGIIRGRVGGGIAGLVEKDAAAPALRAAVIERSFSTGAISAFVGAGGITGDYGFTPDGWIQDCYSTGTITGGVYAGGIAGVLSAYVMNGKRSGIRNCYSIADVSSPGNSTAGIPGSAAGGLIGKMYGTAGKEYVALQNAAALGYQVEAQSSDRDRILGNLEESGGTGSGVSAYISNSYGFDGMKLSPAGAGANGAAGTAVLKNRVWEKSFWADDVGFDLESVWEMQLNSSGESKLPILRGLGGQDGTMPMHLVSYERGESTLKVEASMEEVDFSDQERKVLLVAELTTDASQKRLIWDCDDTSRRAGVRLEEDPDQNALCSLILPGGFSGAVQITVTHAANSSLNAGVTVTALNISLPENLSATYGDSLRDIQLPAGWGWENPDTFAGNVGKRTFPAVYGTNTKRDLEVNVEKCPITVKADDQSKFFGGTDPAFTWTVTAGALVPGDQEQFGGKLGYTGSDLGDYVIVQTEPLAHPNYDITYEAGTMRILPTPGMQDVINIIQALPQPVASYIDADQVAMATNAFDALPADEQGQIPADVRNRLENAQRESGEVNHRNADTAVTGTFLPWYVRILAERIPEDDRRFVWLKGELEKKEPEKKELLALYDFVLEDTRNGESYPVPAGKTVTLTLSNMPVSGRSGIGVVHVKAETEISFKLEYLNCKADNTTVQFETDSFSLYGVFAEESDDPGPQPTPTPTPQPTPTVTPQPTAQPNSSDGQDGAQNDTQSGVEKSPETGDSAHPVFLFLLMAVSLCALAVLVIRRQKGKRHIE
ncbi:MBG domain-containing protein [Diplocloster hominis]|uniref:MBG domain-containing protein n=1 Tax=Diplocloster hominis TaxID=3079010 RepID=UPI0031B9B89A